MSSKFGRVSKLLFGSGGLKVKKITPILFKFHVEDYNNWNYLLQPRFDRFIQRAYFSTAPSYSRFFNTRCYYHQEYHRSENNDEKSFDYNKNFFGRFFAIAGIVLMASIFRKKGDDKNNRKEKRELNPFVPTSYNVSDFLRKVRENGFRVDSEETKILLKDELFGRVVRNMSHFGNNKGYKFDKMLFHLEEVRLKNLAKFGLHGKDYKELLTLLTYYMGVCHEKMGDLDTAVGHYYEVMEKKPFDYDSMSRLIPIYESVGDTETTEKFIKGLRKGRIGLMKKKGNQVEFFEDFRRSDFYGTFSNGKKIRITPYEYFEPTDCYISWKQVFGQQLRYGFYVRTLNDDENLRDDVCMRFMVGYFGDYEYDNNDDECLMLCVFTGKHGYEKNSEYRVVESYGNGDNVPSYDQLKERIVEYLKNEEFEM